VTPRKAPQPPAIPAGLEELLPAFVAEMQKDFAALQGLVVGGGPDLAGHLHAMRGKCAMYGEDTLFGLLGLMERAHPNREALMREIASRVEELGQLI
jgi:hypothetical protein